MEQKLIEAISSIVWYNGHRDLFIDWKNEAVKCLTENKNMGCPINCGHWDNEEHCLWMIFVGYFGEWGTSIRSGWIEKQNLKEFIDILDEIIDKTKESYE